MSSLKFVSVEDNSGNYVRHKGMDGRYIDKPTSKAIVQNGIITDTLESSERYWDKTKLNTRTKRIDVQWIENIPIRRKLKVTNIYHNNVSLTDLSTTKKYFHMYVHEFLRLFEENKFKDGIIEQNFIFCKSGPNYLLKAV
jgi:hypothetical protein